jgi:hypothetical protein
MASQSPGTWKIIPSRYLPDQILGLCLKQFGIILIIKKKRSSRIVLKDSFEVWDLILYGFVELLEDFSLKGIVQKLRNLKTIPKSFCQKKIDVGTLFMNTS